MLKQTIAVTANGLRGLPSRIGTSSVIVIGIAGVVAVLVSVLAMARGFENTVGHTGRPDRVILLRGNSNAELSSTLTREQAQTILDKPGVRRDADGKPIGSAEAVAIVKLQTIEDNSDSNVTMRGVGAQAPALRPELKIVEGRMFQPAVRELIVGRSAQRQFRNLAVGDRIHFRDSDWTVVGAFETGGDTHESELIGDAETVLSAYRRGAFNSVTLQLATADGFAAFKDAVTTDPTLTVEVNRETDYYAKQSERLTKILDFLAYFVGGIMAVGAMFGALNTMYSAVSSRSVEIATLRAIGFSGLPVVISVLVEALLLALLGGAIGAAIAWIAFNGNAINTLGGNFSQVVFRLSVAPALIGLGIAWACAIGMIGGLFPAVRAARLPIVDALRAA
jgi:putative ABC transport system permease protein